jgi:cytochrome c556
MIREEWMRMKNIYAAAAIGAVALLGSVAMAASVGDVIAARQASFKEVGKANKAINEELKKPDAAIAIVRANAAILLRSGDRALKGFARGTGPEAGVKTTALPAIWERPGDFRAGADKMIAAAKALNTAAARGDMAQVRAASAALGQTCKSCHTSFRARD